MMEEGSSRYSKRLRSGTRRRYQDDGISDDEIDGKRSFDLQEKLQCDQYNSDLVKIMEGKDFTLEYIQQEGLRDPIIFKEADGLGLKMPDPDFSVSDVKLFVGSRRMIDVMDAATQKGIEMSMGQWRRYYETPASMREKLYNVISLEFSHTKLENLVDMIDWVDNMWPRHLKERQRDSTNAIIDMQYPKVQKYCLMSVEGCFTDFHIDFGGTSVWYHIHKGRKVFWLIPPTPQNMALYENWVLSAKQGDIFLGDRASACQRIELKQGYTFMIPSGWIHAVYTPMDTLVFGGNFLHSFNIPMQLNVYNIEDRTRVPPKFRYPFFFEMCWYVLDRYLYWLKREDVIKQEDLNGQEENEAEVKEESVEEEEVTPPPHPGTKVHLTPFELEGLWALVHKLEELPPQKKCVPAGIRNAAALLSDIKRLLEEHKGDSPEQSYTGKPIVKWPKRPSWYQPPPPPPLSPLCRPRAPGSGPMLAPISRPVKAASSISALRHRRVRCKHCEGCRRTACGDCTYCRDMRKFGGPGRMKKGCMRRQCLAPVLPATAVCAVCNEGPESVPMLMECSKCAEITHPECIKNQGEGIINKELTYCWECPKCVQDKKTEFSISSEEESDSHVSQSVHLSGPPNKRAHREGIGVEAIKMERNSILQSTHLPVSVSPKFLRQRRLETKGLVKAGIRRSLGHRTSPCRGREVGLRGGEAAGSLREGTAVELERPDSENGQYNGKENCPQRRGGKAGEDENGDCLQNKESEGTSEGGDAAPTASSEDFRGLESAVTVKLQPSKGRHDPSSIVPRLEANLSSKSLSPSYRALLRAPLRNGSERSPGNRLHVTSSPQTLTRQASRRAHLVNRLRSSKDRSAHQSIRERTEKKSRYEKSKSSKSRVASSQNGEENEPGWEREVWVSVFRYMTRPELVVCMAVCKSWYKWGCDKRLWTRISLSRSAVMCPQVLTGIIKRQPVVLDLSHASISKKQLSWLINRLPGLKDLVLSGCNWTSVAALSSPSCPLLRSLDLSWAEGIRDQQIRELLNPPGSDNRSKMKNMQSLSLSGLEVTEATLRLIIRHMPLLTRLELSRCPVTDAALDLLSAVGSSTRNTLAHLNLAGCSSLTDRCLVYLRRLSCLSVLDLRSCAGVSREACERFISELSVNALYCLSDEKLIQRIS
ncbi:hypothetical protein DNTS_014657 [Danionella cerebrum]|uniref:[histone H3]-dimethyl-L-lysine(36) demethylase n=1 Tax=Danionella cerebrum TaxID=2873325 RepID=A0A553Q1U6_9TELE|nr:hypothetical protein DNTS_014657 [Danionella translucida]